MSYPFALNGSEIVDVKMLGLHFSYIYRVVS